MSFKCVSLSFRLQQIDHHTMCREERSCHGTVSYPSLSTPIVRIEALYPKVLLCIKDSGVEDCSHSCRLLV